MATYKIQWNLISQKFDDQYPMFLQSAGVTSEQFQRTVHQTQNLYKDLVLKPAEEWKMKIFLTLILTVVVSFVLIVPGICLPFVFLYAIYKINTAHQEFLDKSANQISDFLKAENESLYFPRGMQFLFKTETVPFHKRVQLVPYIEIVQNASALQPMAPIYVAPQQPMYSSAQEYPIVPAQQPSTNYVKF